MSNVSSRSRILGIGLLQACLPPKPDIPQALDLIEDGAFVDHQGWHGYTPLIVAARDGYTDVVNALLAKGAAVDIKDDQGNTALMSAAACGRIDIVRALLAKGADISPVNKYLQNAVRLALRGNYREVDALLQEEQARRDAARLARENQEHADWVEAGCPIKEDLKLMKPVRLRVRKAGP